MRGNSTYAVEMGDSSSTNSLVDFSKDLEEE